MKTSFHGKPMDSEQIQAIATQNSLGRVHFQFNISQNTGREFEVGYVYKDGRQELFCKRQPGSAPDQFYLCNEFRSLKE